MHIGIMNQPDRYNVRRAYVRSLTGRPATRFGVEKAEDFYGDGAGYWIVVYRLDPSLPGERSALSLTRTLAQARAVIKWLVNQEVDWEDYFEAKDNLWSEGPIQYYFDVQDMVIDHVHLTAW